MAGFRFINRVRSVLERWRIAVAVVSNAVLCEVGARVGLPGVDGSRVQEFFHGTHRGLLPLYNLLVGGAVSRGAVLALGAIPYLQAQFYVWLARAVFPRLGRATAESVARRRAVRLTTIGLALVQSFGFARFLQGIPGAVTDPGIGFVSRSVLLITSGAVIVGWLGDMVVGSATDDADTKEMMEAPEASSKRSRNSSTAPAGPSEVPEMPGALLLESGGLSDLPLPRAAADQDLDRAR